MWYSVVWAYCSLEFELCILFLLFLSIEFESLTRKSRAVGLGSAGGFLLFEGVGEGLEGCGDGFVGLEEGLGEVRGVHFLVGGNESDGSASIARSPCAPYAMHVVLQMIGHIKVNHQSQMGHIQPSRRHRSRHQNT